MSKQKSNSDEAFNPDVDPIDAAIDRIAGDGADDDLGTTRLLEQLNRANEELIAEVRNLSDRALRAEAEIDNVRKRVRRDFEDQLRFATLPLVKDVLNVLDNLERALGAAQSNAASDSLRQGVQMVAEHLKAALAQHQCRAIETAPGDAFDPHRHEALGQEPNADIPAGAIVRVVRAGYQMHDRVVRAAQVLLSAGKPN
jgi:molecular chaperone GrpE